MDSFSPRHPHLPLGEDIYLQLRQLIMQGTWASAAVIREADLVRQLNVSRTPVREALHRLQAEGMLRPVPAGGYEVVRLSRSDILDVYTVREALEGLTARLAAQHATRTSIAELEDCLDELALAQGPEDAHLRNALTQKFHLGLASASRNAYLQSLMHDLLVVFYKTRAPGPGEIPGTHDPVWSQTMHADHAAIVEAIRARNADAAEDAARQHIRRNVEYWVRRSDRSDGEPPRV
jgi:DNA-binding GntR family transcriptional regulator